MKGGERITCDNDFILIGQPKLCARMREPRSVLKIKRYAQRLTHRVCMGDGGSSVVLVKTHRKLLLLQREKIKRKEKGIKKK